MTGYERDSRLLVSTETDRAGKENITQLIGEASVQETAETILEIPELSAERQAFMEERDPSQTYLFGCGDDRNLTTESAAKLMTKYNLDQVGAYDRYFGGLTGLARIAGVTIAMQYGSETLARYGNSFHGFKTETKERIERVTGGKTKVAEHSAESAEGSKTDLNLNSTTDLGCAYDQLVGTVTGVCSGEITFEGLNDQVVTEHKSLLGSDMTELVKAANQAFGRQFFAKYGTKTSITRPEINDLDVPIMILAGNHARSDEIEVNLNFDSNMVSKPGKANEAGAAFYNNDVARAAELIIRAFPELKLQPTLIFAAMIYDTGAVREALAQHEDPSLHARDMRLVRYGNPADAIAYLESVQASL